MATKIKKGTSPAKAIKKAYSKREADKVELLELAGKMKSKINPVQFQKEVRDEWG